MRGQPTNPVTSRWVIEFRLIYHLRMSKADIDSMSDREVMRYYHSLIIQKDMEYQEQKQANRKAQQKRR